MAFTQKVIAEKTMATIKRAAIERTYENGNVKYGIATCRKGGKWVIEMTMKSRSQVVRSIKHHEEMDGVLVWCG